MTKRAKGVAPHLPTNLTRNWSSASRTAFRKVLLKWYHARARDLPWRRTHDPYAIWLSEIMLQQTQAATVIGYFHRFLATFPTVAKLAAASEQEVLRLWEGLGYYRRARQLHQAAGKIAVEHSGVFPAEFEAIRSLPGVGRYTAGAIASFAFGQSRPIVEANTQRLYCRLLALKADPRTKPAQDELWKFAEQILPQRGAGDVNQALIELGSQVCKPKQPLCDSCPVRPWCAAYQTNQVDRIPAAKKKTNYEEVLEAAVVLRDSKGQILLRRRGDKERWAGMWDFPRGALASGVAAIEPQSLDFAKVQEFVFAQTGFKAEDLRERFRLRHGVTRFRIELVCLEAMLRSKKTRREDLSWVKASDLVEVPLSVSARKIANHLTEKKASSRRA